ncbi:histidine phosphatase family protein [uncultured Bifidobacterium sp.]|uniref:histidine phosphatase family protein n=1 Tax=uncultured Bifidobacterium sp. TaxID=165187 RepID=UPI0028DCBE82|nr:histidine phosphatase family protein [uncultured Bifidobacterium sp.]
MTEPRKTHVRAIILVRHGRTAYNAAGRLQGQIDIPLDEVGAWQAQRTGEALRELYVRGAAFRESSPLRPLVVCSDLGRAESTAHAFADPLDVDVHPDPRVRERGFGEWEGMPVDQLRQRFPEDFRLWAEFRGGELRHGAEPKSAVGERGVRALADWSAKGGDGDVLVVFSHGAWIAQTLQTLLGLARLDPGMASLPSMRNAHWARLAPLDLPEEPLRWRLMDYNHGPALADTPCWEHPFED